MSEPESIYHLEYAQRDFRGITDEDMDFNEETLAQVIDEIILESNCLPHMVFLRAMTRALRGTDSAFRLRLFHKKRGKFKSSADQAAEMEYRQRIYMHVLHRQGEGDPKEAAVADASAHFGISRATVFRLMKELDDWTEMICEHSESLVKNLSQDRDSFSD